MPGKESMKAYFIPYPFKIKAQCLKSHSKMLLPHTRMLVQGILDSDSWNMYILRHSLTESGTALVPPTGAGVIRHLVIMFCK